MTEKQDATAPVAPDDVHHAVVKTEDGADLRNSMDEEALKVQQEQGDYSGARGKTDLKEIALVKKLDRRILPTLCVMYFLNYVRVCCAVVYSRWNANQCGSWTELLSPRLV